MSVDLSIVCPECNRATHLGQDMGGKFSFGYGSTDTETPPLIMEWIFQHVYHSAEHLRIMTTNEACEHDVIWDHLGDERA